MNDQIIELYIHIPFCVRKCSYCDFLSFPADEESRERYLAALQKEVCAAASVCREIKEYKVQSVFIGGGTPSVLEEGSVPKLMDTVRMQFDLMPDAEITIEANPCTVTAGKLAGFRAAGINRISLGCQSLDDSLLQMLGRLHDVKTFYRAYELALAAGFANINIDLMSGLPGLTREAWRKALIDAARLDPAHLSVYSLILEEGTPLFKHRDELSFPDEEDLAGMYEDTAAILKEYGYARYEISNYAKPHFECRHNLGYWRGVPYLGLGLGAASFLPRDLVRGAVLSDLETPVHGQGRETGFSSQGSETGFSGQDPGTGFSGQDPKTVFSGQGREMVFSGQDPKTEPDAALRFRNTEDFGFYLLHSADPGRLRTDVQHLTEQDLYSEFMILGLRLISGVSNAEFQERFGRELQEAFREPLEKHLRQGTLIQEDGWIRIPEQYLFVSNQILVDFL